MEYVDGLVWMNCASIHCHTWSSLYVLGCYGAIQETWNRSFKSKNVDDVLTLTPDDEGYSSRHVDELYFSVPDSPKTSTKFTFYFMPPVDASYVFRIKGSNAAGLVFSTDDNPAQKVIAFSLWFPCISDREWTDTLSHYWEWERRSVCYILIHSTA